MAESDWDILVPTTDTSDDKGFVVLSPRNSPVIEESKI